MSSSSDPGNSMGSGYHTANPGASVAGSETMISAVFHPHLNLLPHRPNAAFVSCDSVIFYAHLDVLSTASCNFFGSLLPVELAGYTEQRPLILTITEHSHVLNVMLHTIYNMSSATFEPSMATLISAVACLVKYGIPLQVYIAPGTPLYALLLAHAPQSPLDVYALAGQCDLYDLAVQASPFLLAYRPTMISEEYAERMGPIYYRRLMSLQTSRVEALKEILRDPPGGHPENANCDASNQAGLSRAWELTAAYLIWERRPELTTTSIDVTFEALFPSVRCDTCRNNLKERVAEAGAHWANQKRTI